ncbi:hypothetical protein [Propionivibrio dicarboxylicus]|uniref:Uncharacterized protein n=1 Tax=Propionivibrio dicarboxylicus TaxID=83767 RepID=A0A1G8GAT7_9RHOO|nr:hypothetical protein [Propionivibrio dicarboxylicus]SDH91497.1 hypothetical protein SAMN05660652_02523 [Propionivibrio dicarboxylicus]
MRINFNAGQPKSPLGKFLAAIVGVLTLAAAFMFSLVFVAVIVVAGLIAWGYFWWKTRALRRLLRDQAGATPFSQAAENGVSTEGEIIEGESVRVAEESRRLTSERPDA